MYYTMNRTYVPIKFQQKGEQRMMYAISDEETGRFLSWMSIPMGDKNTYLYITYTGKIGTDFFPSTEDAETVKTALLMTIKRCSLLKKLLVVQVDVDSLPVGETFVEKLLLQKELLSASLG